MSDDSAFWASKGMPVKEKDTCQYNKCGFPLGAWHRSAIKVEGCYDIEERVCEKCGGQQTKFRSSDSATNEAIHDLFEKLGSL